jgi:hypothetical protein
MHTRNQLRRGDAYLICPFCTEPMWVVTEIPTIMCTCRCGTLISTPTDRKHFHNTTVEAPAGHLA